MIKTLNDRLSFMNLKFYGEGSKLFGIIALNVVLTVLTLGLYYPWAKTALRKYLWSESEMKGSRFTFNGTGKELFRGFIIVYGLFACYFIVLVLSAQFQYGVLVILMYQLGIIALIPFVIYGAWKYKISRTSWRGVHFYFSGNSVEFAKMFYLQAFFSIISFGIYLPWMSVKVNNYLFGHTYLGNLQLGFEGKGGDLFGIHILGVFLSSITLFIYGPIYIKNRFNFLIDHITISDEKTQAYLTSTLENREAWFTIFGNGLISIFTLGLGLPWVMVRTLKMYLDNIEIPDVFDLDNLEQSPEDFRDATGDGAADFLDLDVDIGF